MKRLILTLFLFAGFSFSAFSSTSFYVVSKINNNSVATCLGVKVGDKFLNPPSLYSSCVSGYSNFRWGSLFSYRIVVADNRYGPSNLTDIYYGTGSCQEGTEFNEDTKECEEPPPQCVEGETYNPETEQCEKNYCSSDEVFNLWQQEKAACDAKNGFHNWQCDDATKSIESSCNQPNPDACVQGMPQWPDCLDNSGGDIGGGDGGDIGGGGGDGSTTNPGGDGDTSNPDEPDPTQPDMSGLESRLDTLKDLQDQTNQKLGDIKEQSKLIGDLTNQHLKDLVDDAKQRQLVESERSQQLIGKLGSIDNTLGNLGKSLDKLGEGSKTSVADVSCSGTFTCSGNLYECYMARQQWSQSCLLQRLTNTDSQGINIDGQMTDINTSSTELSTKLQEYNSKYGNFKKLVDGEVNIEESLNTINEENGLSFDDKCPEPISLEVLGAKLQISYQPFCDLALYVRAMLMLSASIFSLVMIAKFS